MKFPLTVCVFLLTVVSSLSVDITVTGTEGEPVIIKCPYPEGYENSHKYFYKGFYKDGNIILRTDGTKSSSRFSLQDDHQTRSFTVTIRNLKMEDAGTYGCRAGYQYYKIIHLNVIKDQTISSFSNTPSYQRTSDTNTQSSSFTIPDHQIISSTGIIVTAEALVLLLIGLPLIIVAVLKRKKKKGLSSSTAVFNEQIRDTEGHCNPEDRDTETTVIYTCAS